MPKTMVPPASEPNVLLTFARPALLEGAFGRPRPVSELAIAVDEPARFIQAIGRGGE